MNQSVKNKLLNKPQKPEVYLVLDNLRSIHNVGAIFRTADAAGVSKVFLCGITAYPDNKTIRSIDGKEIDSPITTTKNEAIINYKPSRKCYGNYLYNRISKTALMATKSVRWEYYTSTSDLIKKLKRQSIDIFALEQDSNSKPYHSVCYQDFGKIAIIIGNEANGISKEILEQCDHIVEIEMLGKGKSLNVATSVGIALFRVCFQ